MIYVTQGSVEAMTMADRIAVMKDGVIQQIDSPLKIYNDPANVFVAGFIGSPAINMTTGKIARTNGALHFVSDDYLLKLTPRQEEILINYEDKAIIMGIRPEDIYDSRFDALADFPQKIITKVDFVEPLGNEYHVVLTTEHNEFIARFDPKELPKMGQDLSITFDMTKAHFFDPTSEANLY
jgi:multiple sugar transport system ATP-binding protein